MIHYVLKYSYHSKVKEFRRQNTINNVLFLLGK